MIFSIWFFYSNVILIDLPQILTIWIWIWIWNVKRGVWVTLWFGRNRSKTVDMKFSQFEIFHGYVSKMACRLNRLPYSMLLTTHFSRVFVTTYCPTYKTAPLAISVESSSRFQTSCLAHKRSSPFIVHFCLFSLYHNLYFCQLCCVLKVFVYI